MTRALLDTGPLVSYVLASQQDHEWAVRQWQMLEPPLLTCEPVLTEAAFLFARARRDVDRLFELLETGVVRVGLHLQDEWPNIRALMRRYRDRPMSLADACMVRMSEIHTGARILTFDSDFLIYRRHGNKPIPVSMPGRAE